MSCQSKFVSYIAIELVHINRLRYPLSVSHSFPLACRLVRRCIMKVLHLVVVVAEVVAEALLHAAMGLLLVGVVLVVLAVVLVVELLGVLLGLVLGLLAVEEVLSLGLGEAVNLTAGEASEELLGKLVGDGLA
jgi:hypothetical protein